MVYESTSHTVFLHFQDRGMTNVPPEIFSRNLSLLWNSKIRSNEFPFLVRSMSLNIDMNRIYSLHLFWIYLSNFQIFLNLSENLNRSESWDKIPLELNRSSIDFSQLWLLVGLLEFSYLAFPFLHSLLNDHIFPRHKTESE